MESEENRRTRLNRAASDNSLRWRHHSKGVTFFLAGGSKIRRAGKRAVASTDGNFSARIGDRPFLVEATGDCPSGAGLMRRPSSPLVGTTHA